MGQEKQPEPKTRDQEMKYYLEYFHLWFWAAMHFAHAYLAYHRGDRFDAAQHENQMYEYERRMAVLKLNREIRYDTRY